ncbi:hypothetical protein H257_02900 [Aphanomyces astaci]|uniref:Tc3 transposase DNA binding domain-containing protein n=1 Tax=Aphanomyces astaci TaxID=112090 RepID=W4GZC5_APHAT|nr:hypothetical protein H257_02900 [Aphanomyces astaci]ETV85007.1 hypothetical protein H257_02900 [Aphanomyces astaci]|eukprot:XP_009825025.1 hypothetical protein H257_02900 [Aphanomyces astaci]
MHHPLGEIELQRAVDQMHSSGPTLTEEEQGMILALNAVGKGQREIERLIGRSRSAIALFLSNPVAYNANKRSGRPPKVTTNDVRCLLRTASNSFLSSRELFDECQLTIKARRAPQLLNKSKHLKFIKALASPTLTKELMKAR